jgi:hypothetical protein
MPRSKAEQPRSLPMNVASEYQLLPLAKNRDFNVDGTVGKYISCVGNPPGVWQSCDLSHDAPRHSKASKKWRSSGATIRKMTELTNSGPKSRDKDRDFFGREVCRRYEGTRNDVSHRNHGNHCVTTRFPRLIVSRACGRLLTKLAKIDLALLKSLPANNNISTRSPSVLHFSTL